MSRKIVIYRSISTGLWMFPFSLFFVGLALVSVLKYSDCLMTIFVLLIAFVFAAAAQAGLAIGTTASSIGTIRTAVQATRGEATEEDLLVSVSTLVVGGGGGTGRIAGPAFSFTADLFQSWWDRQGGWTGIANEP